jgi:hypothetical protein
MVSGIICPSKRGHAHEKLRQKGGMGLKNDTKGNTNALKERALPMV